MRRGYEMRARAETAAHTRASILKGAHQLLNQRESTGLTLQEVAAASGVSRATIYKSVGPRAALLKAVFEDQGRRIAFDRVLAAMQIADPAVAVIATVRESCRAWSVMPDAIRKTLALATLDAEIAELVSGYERSRRARLAVLARRLSRTGQTDARVPAPAQASALALLTSFTTFDQLRFDRDARQSTALLVRIACATLGISRNVEPP